MHTIRVGVLCLDLSRWLMLQVDICAEELGNNVPCHVMLHGHLKAVIKQVMILWLESVESPNA